MPQYLVCNYLPDDFDPSTVTEEMMEEIHALNLELIAAGARKFACGVSPAAKAKTVRKQADGRVLVTDGPYTETKEHMGGFWILEAADLDEALAWAPFKALGADIVAGVRRAKVTDGPHLIVWGSSTLTPVLLEHELADEILLLVFPVLLGTGKRFFSDGTPPRELALVSTKAASSGVIISTYKPNGPLRTGTMGA